MGLPAETLHEVNAPGERLPRKCVVLKIHEHIVYLAWAGIPPPLGRLDQFRVHSEPAHSFIPLSESLSVSLIFSF